MKQIIRRLLAVLLCAVLLGCLLTTASGSSNVYLMAVNDTVVEMTAENMPIMVGGTLYVPYTMLSSKYSGINLGVNAQYSTTRRTVLVSSGRMGVIFDPQANTSYDLDQNPLSGRAVVRNSMIYLPIAWVCEYFGSIAYSTIKTEYGTLVRVTNNAVVLSDIDFADAASSMLRTNYQKYMNSIREQNNNQGGNNTGPVGEEGTGPVVYLAFRVGEKTEETARLLENYVHRALFLFTAEQLAGQDELVRRLVGAGHTVGLELTGDNPEDCAAEIRRGIRLLADVARSALTILYAPNLDRQERESLREQGWALWQATLTDDEVSNSAQLFRALGSSAPNFVEITCGARGLGLVNDAMQTLAGTGYRLRQAVAPVF